MTSNKSAPGAAACVFGALRCCAERAVWAWLPQPRIYKDIGAFARPESCTERGQTAASRWFCMLRLRDGEGDNLPLAGDFGLPDLPLLACFKGLC